MNLSNHTNPNLLICPRIFVFDKLVTNIRHQTQVCQTQTRISGYWSNSNPGFGSQIFDLRFTVVNNPFILRQSLRDLENYSLIRVWDEGRKITIHRLVQHVVRDDLNSEYRHVLTAQVLRLALSAFPHTVEGLNRYICRLYYSQVMAILANLEDNRNWVDSLNECVADWQLLSDRLAFYLLEDGYYSD